MAVTHNTHLRYSYVSDTMLSPHLPVRGRLIAGYTIFSSFRKINYSKRFLRMIEVNTLAALTHLLTLSIVGVGGLIHISIVLIPR